MARVLRQAGEDDPFDERVVPEVLRERHRVGAVLAHAQVQRLEPAQREVAVHRRGDRAEFLVDAASDLVDEVGLPDDHASDEVAVPVDVFRGAVNDDVDADRERPEDVGRREGVVDDRRDAARLRPLHDRLEVGDFERGVVDGLEVDRLRLGRYGAVEFRDGHLLHERVSDAEFGEDLGQQRVRPAVDRVARDDVIAVTDAVQDRERDRGHSRRDGERRGRAFERRHLFLKVVLRRVARSPVGEDPGLVAREIAFHLLGREEIGARHEDGGHERSRLGVGGLSRVDGLCREGCVFGKHDSTPPQNLSFSAQADDDFGVFRRVPLQFLEALADEVVEPDLGRDERFEVRVAPFGHLPQDLADLLVVGL